MRAIFTLSRYCALCGDWTAARHIIGYQSTNSISPTPLARRMRFLRAWLRCNPQETSTHNTTHLKNTSSMVVTDTPKAVMPRESFSVSNWPKRPENACIASMGRRIFISDPSQDWSFAGNTWCLIASTMSSGVASGDRVRVSV